MPSLAPPLVGWEPGSALGRCNSPARPRALARAKKKLGRISFARAYGLYEPFTPFLDTTMRVPSPMMSPLRWATLLMPLVLKGCAPTALPHEFPDSSPASPEAALLAAPPVERA